MHLSRIINPPEEGEDSRSPRRSSDSKSHQISGCEPPTEATSVDDIEGSDDYGVRNISFIVCMEAKEEGKVTYVSPSVTEVLGYDPEEVIGEPAAKYAHPDDVVHLYRAYQEMIDEDKAACVLYHREPFKDPSKGYLLCTVTCTRVGGHLIGASSPAESGSKTLMRTSSTASEVIVITPAASQLAYRRWNVPSPPAPAMSISTSGQSTSSRESSPSDQTPGSPSSPENSPGDELARGMCQLTLQEKPEQARRGAFVLDRFSRDVSIMFCVNDDIVPRSLVVGRSFYDFVAPSDEARVRQAIDATKSWAVDESGWPAEGGFSFNRFRMYPRGRDSKSATLGEGSRRRRSLQVESASPSESSSLRPKRERSKQRVASERGVSISAKDTLLVDSIFSPQSDGIIVVIRPALLPTRP